jgi:hypothetical protein
MPSLFCKNILNPGIAFIVAWNVFARLNTGIVGSNPARGMDVCVYSVFVLSCVGSGLATVWSLVQGVLPIVYKCRITEPHKEEAKARYGLQRHIRRRRITFIVRERSKKYCTPCQNTVGASWMWLCCKLCNLRWRCNICALNNQYFRDCTLRLCGRPTCNRHNEELGWFLYYLTPLS